MLMFVEFWPDITEFLKRGDETVLSSAPPAGEVWDLVRCRVTCIHSFLLVWARLNNSFLSQTQPPVFACIVLCFLLASLIHMEHSVVSYYVCHKCVKWIFISWGTLKVKTCCLQSTFFYQKLASLRELGGEPPSKRLLEPVVARGGKSTGLLGSSLLSALMVSGPETLATSSPLSMLLCQGGRLDLLTSCALFHILWQIQTCFILLSCHGLPSPSF